MNKVKPEERRDIYLQCAASKKLVKEVDRRIAEISKQKGMFLTRSNYIHQLILEDLKNAKNGQQRLL